MSVVTAEDPLHRSSSGGSRGSWLSEVVLPTVIVGVILIISLFAVIVLLMIRRHFGSPGHDVDGPYVVHHTPMDAGAQVESLRIYNSHSGGPTVKANFGSMKTMFSTNRKATPDYILVSL